MSGRTFRASTGAYAAVIAAVVSAHASGAITFSLQADVTNVELLTGQTAPVSIFLVETVTGADTSVLAAEKGLAAAQVTVLREQAFGAAITSFTRNTSFNGFTSTDTTPATAPYSSVDVSQGVGFDATTGVSGPAVGGVTRVLLLSLVVEAADAANVTSFSLSDNPRFTETVTFGSNGINGRALDAQLASGLFSVTTYVPEPAFAAVAAAAAMGVAGRRRCASAERNAPGTP